MKRSDLAALLLFFLLPIALLWPVTLGGQTLIPADNLFAFPPWQSFAAQFNATAPHNELLSDLLLENYAWKKFIVESLQQKQIPLWNPYLFTGVPFLAAGQHSALYPFSVLFYIFPIEAVYGWFVAIQFGIAGAAMFVFARAIGIGRWGALVAGLTYEFSGFFVVSIVFPMVISAACWLPLLLLCEEKIVQGKLGEIIPQGDRFAGGDKGNRYVFGWIAVGALVLAVSFLAGHVEIAYYNLIVMAFFGAWRIIAQVASRKSQVATLMPLIAPALALSIMVCLGIALAAVQIVPLYELVSHSFRQGSQSYETIVSYAFPIRQVITFFIPDFFGNPAHHNTIDWWSRAVVPLIRNVAGENSNNTFWGIKNYVEAGSYMGLLPLLLALIAIISAVRHRSTLHASHSTFLFTTLALLSLAFMFGTPLYAILFYGLPGINQLHSPFRWVYPFTLSIAVLAGIGMQVLEARRTTGEHRPLTPSARDGASAVRRLPSAVFAWLPLLGGLLILMTLVASLLVPAPFLSLAERVLRSSDLAQHAFPDARAFFSYEALNVAKFALFLALSGLVFVLAARDYELRITNYFLLRYWKHLAVLVIVADLFAAWYGFNPAADPQLLKFTPPAVKFLQQDRSLFRVATLNADGEKTLNANVGMFYGLHDVRGYDSIIPKQYADWMNLIEGQGELIYNRIAPFYWHGSLDSALLDLANVKYVLTTQEIPNTAKFTKVYTGEVNIYRNRNWMGLVFLVDNARPLTNLAELKSLDPRKEVLIEGLANPASDVDCNESNLLDVKAHLANEVVILAQPLCNSWLVLADAYFTGWQAFDSVNNGLEEEIPIYRANGNFRAVQLSAGIHTVRFRYNPLSFRVGAVISFFAAMALLLMGGYWAWGRRSREPAHTREASRVLKNSAVPMVALLLNKAIDTVFTLLMLRVFSVAEAGKFGFAVLIIGYCDIVVNFGLSTLVTRDVSQNRALANRYLSNTAIMRLIVIGALAPLLLLYLWVSGQPADISLAIILLFIGLIPSSFSASLSAIFYATEQMEYPAAVTVITTLLKVTVGTLVLLAGLGFVGLAGANIFVNVATLAILFVIFARQLFLPRFEFDAQFNRNLVGTSYPLMFNDMLSRVFNRVDTFILKSVQGDVPTGWYTTTYKYLEGVNILPSTFTIALFPLLSRYAAGAPDALLKAYVKAMKYLVVIAMPLMVLSFVYADAIILFFGGEKYLPESAIALRLIIGFLPLSFINNVTHYVLIAVNQQKYLTRAFVAGALFNVVANLIFVPLYSFRAAAVITIFSELALLVPFYLGIRRHVGAVNWLDLLWRPILATFVMGGVILGFGTLARDLGFWSFAVIIPIALVAYFATLIVTRTFNAEDREMMKLLVPAGMRNTIRGKAT